MITLGTHLVTPTRTGDHVCCRVAAIRRAPFSYVELEPLCGGSRRAVPMRVAEALERTNVPQP